MPPKPRGLAERRRNGVPRFFTSYPPPPPSRPLSSSSANAPGNGGNDHEALFKNLVEMVPLVESLMDRRANPSFKRRASMVYTPTPANQTKVLDPKGRKPTQTVSAKEQRDCAGQDNAIDSFSIFSSRELTEENVPKDMEELTLLREQLDDLHKKLSEKDEALKSAKESMNQMSTIYTTIDELRRQVIEKDSLVMSANSQLSNAQIKLADRQAALEKLEWEAMSSNTKVEELQGHLDSMDFEISAFMHLFLELSKDNSAAYSEENISSFQNIDHLPHIDDIGDTEMAQMEAARMAYISAVAAAKENPSDESLAAAAEARITLEAFVL